MVLATIRRHDRRFLPGLSSPPSPVASLLLERYAVSPSASSLPPPFSSPLLPSLALSSSFVRERRQVGIRAAVNSPAPLSALMSLLLFALLNAIRAYSVSLPPPLGTRATPRRPFDFLATHVGSRTEVRARALAHTRTRILRRSSAAAFARSRARCGTLRYASNTHATRRRVRTCA